MGEVYTGNYRNIDLSKYDTRGLQTMLANLERSTNLTQDQRDYIASIKSELSKRGLTTKSDGWGGVMKAQSMLIIGGIGLLLYWLSKRKK